MATRLFSTPSGDTFLCDRHKLERVSRGERLGVPQSAAATMMGLAPWPTGQEFCADCKETPMGEHECVYQDAVLFWKAEALLCALGKGTPIDRLVIAAVIPVPIPHDVALAHMEEAKVALLAAGIGKTDG